MAAAFLGQQCEGPNQLDKDRFRKGIRQSVAVWLTEARSSRTEIRGPSIKCVRSKIIIFGLLHVRF